MRTLALLGMLLVAGTRAAVVGDGACLTELGFLAATDSDDPGLAITAYEKFLNTLGASASEATLKKMIEGKDPFVFPDQDGVDFSVLQKRLAQFRGLVKKKGWDTPPIREQMLGSLRQRLGEVNHAADQRDAGLAKTWQDHSFTFPSAHLEYAISPDGRWVLASHCPSGAALTQSWTMSSVDLGSRQMQTQPGSTGSLSGPEFSGDGKFLLFPMDNHQLKKVPITDGVPDWANAVTLGDHLSSGWLRTMKGVSDRYFFAAALGGPVYRFDLKENTRTYLNLTPHLPIPPHLTNSPNVPVTGSAEEWVPLADGKHIAYVIERLHGVWDRRITVFEIKDDGKLVPKRTLGPWSTRNNGLLTNLHLTENGEMHYLRKWDYFVAMPGATDGVKRFTITPPPGEWNMERPSVQHRPGHPEVTVSWHDNNHKRYYVQFWNTDTGELMGGMDLPERTGSLRFTPDGTRMLSWQVGKKQTIVVSNPENLKPPPANHLASPP